MKTTNKINHLVGAALSLLVTFKLTQNPAALARLLLLGVAVLVAAPSQAAKPGGGGTGGGGTPNGTIYFLGEDATSGGTAAMTTMNADGSTKTRLGLYLFGAPSGATHGGHRWLVCTSAIGNEYYPNGTRRREVLALRDDYDYATNNNANTRVLLTDNILLEPWDPEWVPGDAQISFIGRRFSSGEPGATFVEGGLYTASLVFDADGNIIGLAAQPASPAIPVPLVEPAPGDLRPDFLAYSWAPTAEMVAYSNYADNELWVGDLLGAHIRIYNGTAHMPQWCPDGTKIAFSRSGTYSGIYTIKPDGTSAKWIIPSTSTWIFIHAKWSPDGRYLVFVGQSKVENNHDLFRASASGGNLVQLTFTPAPFREQISEAVGGWR